jgi:hypothetical protein
VDRWRRIVADFSVFGNRRPHKEVEKWDLMVAGMSKRDLLREVLLVFGMWKTP